ncbi:MAG: hypothetical protein OXG04_10955 [Acidobacteria bacterium]|nr:hypothetical protein [Acidobacteriota bacterium]
MDATAWTVVGIGVTILIAIGASFQSLRKGMAKLEGLLEGLREAITGKRAA